ncbi:NAD-dependent epimerase/dehydratase family protein [Dyadobacter arcticus]|uniref:UDP-glucose 4-epimerase n=1 Tax=Dyadobacter arcticus TaxID=1078754 RepID=A0ABX0UHI7_9BACT|nr:NAD(P)-dependent oxidoreductase [Dyadobacter arcticus]NIJ52488.1 UDP-glucose 4-epimerase [Dyadobacter arcticus]
MSILVTGSAGHLGEGVVRTLRAQGKKAIGLDIQPSAFTDLVGSIVDRGFVEKAMEGVVHVIHTATLHKPHVGTHSKQDFIDTNISGTLNLLEEAASANVNSFVFTSTTSVFGEAMNPQPGQPAAWVTEELTPIPKNIYGVTKLAAENLCELLHRKSSMPIIVLRTSRFFPEDDDNALIRQEYDTVNVQALELLYRRLDIEDAVNVHLLALEKAASVGFGKFIVSATTPFAKEDLSMLRENAPEVISKYFPDCKSLFEKKGWKIFPNIERVYDSKLATKELGWQPGYDFAYVLQCLREGMDFRSPLAIEVGSKGYHQEQFDQGPYPVEI